MVTIRRAEVADAVSLAPRLREADRQECLANLGIDPKFILPYTVIEGGPSWAFIDDGGKCIGLFGVDPVDQHPHFGLCWMVTSDDVFKHKKQILRDSPIWLNKLHDLYPLLGNHVDARNAAHVRWLRWLGFSMLRTIPEFGVERRPFIEFAKLRSEPCA
ncbi:hypothetical protein CO661_24090 [Sinorhizobium fredii]|uniref:DUF2833 domain-containing protein n=1 Tax=Rhizobium fredii TaxID=380 RepID=A0A2A6LSP3_RHIFR|nr:hypothetical protein [Sinorhizobium fredii]PDT45347.1 hypothetical protein CO661_24090 [Sinorhizobium fredii]